MFCKQQQKLVFGSYPYRGKIQPARLICEYIGVKYQNLFMNPIEWDNYKKNEAKNWIYQEIPFLKHGDLVLTNPMAAAQYICQKHNRTDLLAKTEQETIFINSSALFQKIIVEAFGLECEMKKCSPEEQKARRQIYWKQKFYPRFKKAEESSHQTWFFSHLSILDFFIYEDYRTFSSIYPEMKNLKNIGRIFQNVANLLPIKKYENSKEAIKQSCPIAYSKQFFSGCKASTIKKSCISVTMSDKSDEKMDLQ